MKEIRTSGDCWFLVAINAKQAIGEFGPALARVAACHEREPARRDELLEEIFLAIRASAQRQHEFSRLKTFLFRVAHNRATSFVQRLPRAPSASREYARETAQLDAIRELRTPQRVTITLIFENFCESEIAEVLGLPVERVRLYIERGKQQLGMRFDELRDRWRHQHAEVKASPAWLGICSRWPNILMAVQLAGATAGALTGVWLAYMAWRLASVPSGVCAVVLLMTAPTFAIMVFLARKEDLKWESESLESVLVSGCYRSEASLIAIRLGRGYLCLIGSSIAVFWVSELGGLISARVFLEVYTGIWVAIAVAYLPWLSCSEKRVFEERAITRRLLGEVTAA